MNFGHLKMRFLFELEPSNFQFEISLDYNYAIHSCLYKIMSNGDPDYAKWLHDEGFGNGAKRTKFFTFSKLYPTEQYSIQSSYLISKGNLYFYLSTPELSNQIKSFIEGAFKTHRIHIFNSNGGASFRIKAIESLPEPKFKIKQKYKMLSPTLVSDKNEIGNEKYLFPWNDRCIEILKTNLIWKYELLHNKAYDDILEIEFDFDYIKSRDNKITKLIKIKPGQPDETRLRCFSSPITITAAPEMHRIAYDCGLGKSNAQGLGTIQTINMEENRWI